MPSRRRLTLQILSLLGLVLTWWIAAEIAASTALPGPAMVWQAFLDRQADGDYFWHLKVTLARAATAFVIAMAIGSAIGIFLGARTVADHAFFGWLIFLLNVPALVVIILCYIWFGLNEVAAISAVAINKIPNVAVTLREGARALSRDLNEMALVYRYSRLRRLRHVILPQMAPYFAVAARNGMALIWKIVLVVELLGRPDGVGFQLHVYFQLFDVATILAYTLGFIVVVQLIELLLFEPWERFVTRWRR